MNIKINRVLALALALSITPVISSALTGHQVCTALGDNAEAVMTLRQQGTTLSKIMDITKESEIATRIALEAYKVSRYSSREYQNQAISDFRNKIELSCYNELGQST